MSLSPDSLLDGVIGGVGVDGGLGDSASKRKRTKPWSPEEDAHVQALVKKHGGGEEELRTLGPSNIKW